jgi:Pyridoxamine 5'-phosphate oxidase
MVNVAEVMANPITQELLRNEGLVRLSYSALDGSPRVIPIGYLWDGESFLMWTIPISAKVTALAADPRVALVIDVGGPTMRVLLARGTAELSTVDGVPDGYLEASHRNMPREAWDGFDTQVRGLYPQMVAITVKPTWAKLIDFETTAPSAVEEMARRAASRQG